MLYVFHQNKCNLIESWRDGARALESNSQKRRQKDKMLNYSMCLTEKGKIVSEIKKMTRIS